MSATITSLPMTAGVTDVHPSRRRTLTLLTAAFATSLGLSSGNAQKPRDVPVFRTSTAAVTVDVVVRDRRGEPVVGLTSDDFEVFEDGVPQQIIGFAAMASERGVGKKARAEVPSLTRPVTPVIATDTQSVVALVFQHLSPQPRAAAVKAARAMVATLAPDERAGIFLVDLGLSTLAPFTRSPRELETALDGVLRRPPVSAGVSSPGVAETEGPAGSNLSRESAEAENMRKRLEAPFEGPRRSGAQSGSLTDVIALLARFSGRKAIMLFSEGLIVSPRFETVVDRARAANVSIYTINSRGLEPGGSMSLTGRKLTSINLTAFCEQCDVNRQGMVIVDNVVFEK